MIKLGKRIPFWDINYAIYASVYELLWGRLTGRAREQVSVPRPTGEHINVWMNNCSIIWHAVDHLEEME